MKQFKKLLCLKLLKEISQKSRGEFKVFIELENDHVIRSEDVITILDVQLAKTSIKLKKLLKNKKEQNQLLGEVDNGKSIIVTDEYIYYSLQYSMTLKKRFIIKYIKNNTNNKEKI